MKSAVDAIYAECAHTYPHIPNAQTFRWNRVRKIHDLVELWILKYDNNLVRNAKTSNAIKGNSGSIIKRQISTDLSDKSKQILLHQSSLLKKQKSMGYVH